LVKNVEQFDSIQETGPQPRILTVFHWLSGSFRGLTQGKTAVPAALRHPALPLNPPASGTTFDHAHFHRQTFGDADLQREIIQLFLAQIEDARKTIRTPMTTTSWRFLTHTLRGAAASVGALRLAGLAAAWEIEGSPQDAALRGTILAQFEAEAAAFSVAVRGYQD
jgi:HPt (histidine-containing phosphotransfer) domain-containing protein